MLSQALRQLRYPVLLSLIPLAGVLLAGPAPASRIEYDILSSRDPETSPFSGIFVSGDDNGNGDNGHDNGDNGLFVLSDDLTGLLAFSTDNGLFLDGQELRVEVFSLTGTARICDGCAERAIEVMLDSDSVSVLEWKDGALEGSIDLVLTMEGYKTELTLTASGKTTDPELNFATPRFVSLFLALDADIHDFEDESRGGSGKKGGSGSNGDDNGDGRIFLQAQGPVVPEPDTFFLLGGGLLALTLLARRGGRRRAS